MEELWVVCLSAELGATLLVGNYKATTKKRDRTNSLLELRNGRKINTDERGRSENVDCKQSRAYDQNIDNYYPTLLAE